MPVALPSSATQAHNLEVAPVLCSSLLVEVISNDVGDQSNALFGTGADLCIGLRTVILCMQ